MKKFLKANKGFAMAELLAVSVGVLTLFTILFSNYLPLLAEFENRLSYNDVTAEYAVHYIRQIYYDSQLFEDGVETSKSFSTKIDQEGYFDGSALCDSASGLPQMNSDDCKKITDIKTMYGIDKILITKYKLKYNTENKYTNNSEENNKGMKNTYKIGEQNTDPGVAKYVQYLPDYSRAFVSSSNEPDEEYFRILIKTNNFGYATSPILSTVKTADECFLAKRAPDGKNLIITDFLYGKEANGSICGKDAEGNNIITLDNSIKSIRSSEGKILKGKIVGIADGDEESHKGVFTPGYNVTDNSNYADKTDAILDQINIKYDDFNSVGSYAFAGTNIKSLSLKSGDANPTISTIVGKDISDYAFSYMNNLETVTLDENVNYGSDDETDTIKYGSYVFAHNDNLATINNLDSCTFNAIEKNIGMFAYSSNKTTNGLSIKVSSKTKVVPNEMFRNTKIKTIDLSSASNLTTIGNYAFSQLGDLGTNLYEGASSVELGLNFSSVPLLTSIGTESFAGFKITSLDFGTNSKLKQIGNASFKGVKDSNSDIKTLSIPKTVSEIGGGAFQYGGINTLNIPTEGSSLETIGQSAFQNNSITGNLYIPCTIGKFSFADQTNNDSNVDLSIYSKDIIAINEDAFRNAKIKSITFVKDDKNGSFIIGRGAFRENSNLIAVNMNADTNVTSIGMLAFLGCKQLKEITIPRSIPENGVGARAFKDLGTEPFTVHSFSPYYCDINNWCKGDNSSLYYTNEKFDTCNDANLLFEGGVCS